MLAFLSVILAAIIFEYSNGFHDAANAFKMALWVDKSNVRTWKNLALTG